MNVSIWIREVGRLTLFCPRERHEELLLSVCRERLLCLENVVERLIARSYCSCTLSDSFDSFRICKKKKKSLWNERSSMNTRKEKNIRQSFEPFKYQRWKIHKRIRFNDDDSSRSSNEKLFFKISSKSNFPISYLIIN